MNLTLPNDLKHWVQEQAKSGGYESAGEYLRDMLRRARERQAKRELDESLVATVNEGATIVMDDDDWSRIRKAARNSVSKVRRGKK